MKLSLTVEYTDGYPDTLPLLSLEPIDGELDEAETAALIESMRAVVRPPQLFACRFGEMFLPCCREKKTRGWL